MPIVVAVHAKSTVEFTAPADCVVNPGGPQVDTRVLNDDGRLDLICQFETQKTGLGCDSTTVTLIGRTVDGRRFEGQDDVKIVGC